MNSQRNPFTIRRVISLVLFAGVAAYCVSAQTQQQLCPGCYKDQVPFPGRYGPASSTDPRRVIKIKVSSSWNIDQNGNATPGQTNPTIFNAFNDQNAGSGTAMWNNARDGSNTTSVYFQLDQVSDPDIIIKLGDNPSGGCASTDFNKIPYVMTLPSSARNWTPTQIALIVAHELGHTIGLTHAKKQTNDKYAPDCPESGVKSIMLGYTGACKPVATGIEATDIQAHNKQFQSRLVFCRIARAGGYATLPDEDPSGGDPCDNCDPSPPSCFVNTRIYISSDGLGCYHIVYVEETYCDGLFVSSTTYAWDVCTTGPIP